MANLKKSTKIRGIFSSESPDRAGEIVKIDGVDLSAVHEHRALVNSEHQQDFAKTVGRILSAKKIFSEKDCVDKFEKDSYNSVGKVPLIVGSIELFDDEEHSE